jgi:PKHD-type hydroxylase
MIIYEPRWKSYVVETTSPIFTSHQCDLIIKMGKSLTPQNAPVGFGENKKIDTKTRTSHVSFIPFNKMPEMYETLEKIIKQTNGNHFGFDGIELTEPAQYTEYSEGGFYDWHMDSNIDFKNEPPVRKISMTCLLSDEFEFEGGGLEIYREGNIIKPKQGQAVFFASFIQHRVVPVTKGIRKSLVMWFGGPPLK